MNQIISFIFGACDISVAGAAPERCINELPKENITFWNIRFQDEMHYRFCILAKDQKAVKKIALKSYCTIEECRETGIPILTKRLFSRPTLLISMALALFLTFFLQSFVWVIEVEGNKTVPKEVILRELEAQDIHFGTWAGEIDSQTTKNLMLNAVPSLSWLAVNRNGGKLSVLVTERESDPAGKPNYDTVNIVAAKDGVITDYSISEGMKLCSRGDTVKAGQILVSGYEDYGLFIRNVCAEAEIYAKTWCSGTLVMPSERMQKVYTGKTEKQISLLVGRKRIKLFGNSSNFEGSCDKMVFVKRVSLPGYTFPLAVETVVAREYTQQSVSILPQEAEALLREAWKRNTLSSMVAGKIDDTKEDFSTSNHLYILQSESTCTEMIAKPAPIIEPDKGDTNE